MKLSCLLAAIAVIWNVGPGESDSIILKSPFRSQYMTSPLIVHTMR